MENFNELLQKYADFIVRVGVNPQPGQTLIINCPLEGAPLARLCVRSAYEAGARDVQVNWQDDAVTRIRMELAETLLARTDYPVKVIASQCGYALPFSFTRAFVKHAGMPPQEYRRLSAAGTLPAKSGSGGETAG